MTDSEIGASVGRRRGKAAVVAERQVRTAAHANGHRGSFIHCKNVRTHNLKGFDLHVPIGLWTVVTGVSGSGKSSLAFDTIYAESQRRFLETLGTYERQFLSGIPQGEFDEIEPIPPAVALKQANRTADPRAVIGTSADVIYPLRTLFGSLMNECCAFCGDPVTRNSVADFLSSIESFRGDLALSVLFRIPAAVSEGSGDLKSVRHLLDGFLVEGYTRALLDGLLVRTEDLEPQVVRDAQSFYLVMDVIGLSDADFSEDLASRIGLLWEQLDHSRHFGTVHAVPVDLNTSRADIERSKVFHVSPYCMRCERETELIRPADLDWQTALGACATCQGLGNIPVVDENKVVPDQELSLKDGAIKPWTTDTYRWAQKELLKACRKAGFAIDIPYKRLGREAKDFIWGRGKSIKSAEDFVPIDGFFSWLEEERYKKNSRILLAKYRSYKGCPACKGARVGEQGRRAVALNATYDDLFNGEIRVCADWLKAAGVEIRRREAIELYEIHREVEKKIDLLIQLGLGSSTLSRRSKTLSGGEYQRVLLTRVIGNGLSDALYVLDEPSVGLGMQEIPALVAAIKELKNQGNTVLMVEHDPQLVRAADNWIELGPGGGHLGGQLISAELSEPASLHLDLSQIVVPTRQLLQHDDLKRWIWTEEQAFRLDGFHHLNCDGLRIEVPLGRMTVISGPSGAGKSTVLACGLDQALRLALELGQFSCAVPDGDEGRGMWTSFSIPSRLIGHLQHVSVEQKAMHRTVTSVPATVLGLMDDLRRLFAGTEDARMQGLTASDFSFNGGGSCPECGGRGFIKEDLFFLGEVEKGCEECGATRYRKDVLMVTFKGRTIAEWMATSLAECAEEALIPSRQKTFQLCVDLGLGQLPLGMPTTQISGGESQRLRIAAALAKKAGSLICLLDEPSRGLSEQDIGRMLGSLRQLCNDGHTLVVVEHHEAFHQAADQLLEMGPGSGTEGGRIVRREVSSS